MGIPFFFSTLLKKYENITTNEKPNIHNYFMDFNGTIHPISKKMIEENKFDEDLLIKNLEKKVKQDIKDFKPKKTFICVDGVVPMAKIIQQRKRRYLSVFRNKIDQTNVIWDTNAITPGTKFMTKLNDHFNKVARKTIIYDGSDNKGEGEHKIFEYMKNLKKDGEICLINGLDADLIILSLMSQKPNIFLMREDNEILYVSIDKLREAIIKELVEKWNIQEIDDNISNELVETYCVMCSLMGNDFIPHLLTLNFKSNGYDKLISYTGNAIKNNGLLITNNTINYNTLIDIFQQIYQNEDIEFHREVEKYMKFVCNQETKPSEFYGIKNKTKLIEEIYCNNQKWRSIYYKEFFQTNILNDTSVVQQACYQYVYGIYWTYNYYKKQNIDNVWYYPYQYPPSVKDIYNFIVGNKSPEVKNIDPKITSDIQLQIVLPIESHNLLKEQNMRHNSPNSCLYHLYPKKYKIHTFMKKHLWECEPVLPTINLNFIMKHI